MKTESSSLAPQDFINDTKKSWERRLEVPTHQGLPSMCAAENVFSKIPFYHESVFYIFISKFTKFDRKWPQFLFFDNKVSTQQHFVSCLFRKNAEKLKIHARLECLVYDPTLGPLQFWHMHQLHHVLLMFTYSLFRNPVKSNWSQRRWSF